MKILVVGGAIVDFVARPTSAVALGTSNEGQIQLGAGGAARNVAESLKRLGCEVTLVTDLAEDFLGRFLLENLEGLGIETRLARRERTGIYLALLNAEGGLDRGFCQTGTERVQAGEVLAAVPDLGDFDGVVLDANLNAACLETLAVRCRELGLPYALETVAHERCLRAKGAIAGCTLIKPDRSEAHALTGLPCRTRFDAAACARELRRQGAGTVIVSLGEEGFHAEARDFSGHLNPAPTRVVDVTGAGDALFTATFVGLLRGLPLPRTLEAARRAAALACASPHAVSPELGPHLLDPA